MKFLEWLFGPVRKTAICNGCLVELAQVTDSDYYEGRVYWAQVRFSSGLMADYCRTCEQDLLNRYKEKIYDPSVR